MYTQWFQLNELPFRLRPEPQLLFEGGTYGEAVTQLRGLLAARRGLVTLIGAAGAGKTTILRALAAPAPDRIVVSLSLADVAPPEMFEALHQRLGLPPRRGVPPESVELIARRVATEAAQGRCCLVVVDDAHHVPLGTLRQLLRLAQLEPAPLVFIAGEPELQELLMAAGRDGDQAAATVVLPRFTLTSTEAYVVRRLRAAGVTRAGLFERAAFPEIQRYTGGVPALINVLCDAALKQAQSRRSHTVTAEDVRSAVQELNFTEQDAEEMQRADTAAHVAPVVHAALQVSRKGVPVAQVTLQPGCLVIGRATDSGLQLDSEFVSRRHCQIVTESGRSIIEDLGSTNGIIVNGRPRKRHALAPGDRVIVGDHTLTYVDKDAAAG